MKILIRLSYARAAILASLLLGIAPAASATVIDNFQSGAFDIVSGLGQDITQTQSGLATSDVIGGSRTVRVAQNGGNGTVEASVTPAATGDPLAITWTSPAKGDVSGFVSLTYANLSGADLTAGGADRFSLDMGTVVPGFSGDLSIYVQTGNGASDTLFQTMNTAGTYQFLFSHFSNAAYFNDVSTIELTIGNVYFLSGPTSGTASASLFQTASASAAVPEPATFALLGLGIALLGLIRQRRC